MSIHNLRYSDQLIKIATRNKTNFEKLQYSGAEINSVRVIVTSAVSVFIDRLRKTFAGTKSALVIG